MRGFLPTVVGALARSSGLGGLLQGDQSKLSDATTRDGKSYNKLLSEKDIGFQQLFGYEIVPMAYRCVVMQTQLAVGTPLVVCKDGKPFMIQRDHAIHRLLRDPARPSNISRDTLLTRAFMELFGQGYTVLHIRRRDNGVPYALENATLTGNPWGGAINLSDTLNLTVPGRRGNILLNDVRQENVIILYDETWYPYTGRAEHPLASKARNPVEAYKKIMLAHLYALEQGGHQKLYVAGKRTQSTIRALQGEWQDNDGGPEKAGLPTYLGDPENKIYAVSHSAEQQQTRAMMDFLGTEICRAYGVDPRFAYDRSALQTGAKERAGSGLPEENTRFLDHGFRAKLQSISGALTQKLLPPTSRLEIVFDTNKLTLGTLMDKAAAFDLLTAKSPGMTPNEGRQYILGLDRNEDPDSDKIHPTKGTGPMPGRQGPARDNEERV